MVKSLKKPANILGCQRFCQCFRCDKVPFNDKQHTCANTNSWYCFPLSIKLPLKCKKSKKDTLVGASDLKQPLLTPVTWT